MNWHPDRPPMWHEPWWHTWHGWVPLLLILILAGVVIWLVVRMNRMEHARAMTAPPPTPIPAGSTASAPGAPDPALEQARMRYANGEIDREAFLAIWSDLGGAPPDGDAGTPPTGGVDPEPDGS